MAKIFLSHPKRDLELFYHQEAIRELQELGRVVHNPLNHFLNADELLNLAGDAEVIITEWNTGASRKFFEKAGTLKAFVRCGVTTENIDLDGATAAGILVINTPSQYTIPMAELTIGLMINLARNIIGFNQDTKREEIPLSYNTFIRENRLSYDSGFELAGQTVGIIGLGDIGKKVAELALGFEMRVLAYDPYVKETSPSIKLVGLNELLENSRFITIHCKETAETRHLINEDNIKLIRSDAFLINTARGSIVQETALRKALVDRQIAGAALDVYETEPEIKGNPLLNLPKVITLPHIGSNTPGTIYRQAIKTVEITRLILAGQIPESVVNPEAIQRFLKKQRGTKDLKGVLNKANYQTWNSGKDVVEKERGKLNKG